MNCGTCGTQNDPRETTCMVCGVSLTAASEAPIPAPPPEAPPPPVKAIGDSGFTIISVSGGGAGTNAAPSANPPVSRPPAAPPSSNPSLDAIFDAGLRKASPESPPAVPKMPQAAPRTSPSASGISPATPRPPATDPARFSVVETSLPPASRPVTQLSGAAAISYSACRNCGATVAGGGRFCIQCGGATDLAAPLRQRDAAPQTNQSGELPAELAGWNWGAAFSRFWLLTHGIWWPLPLFFLLGCGEIGALMIRDRMLGALCGLLVFTLTITLISYLGRNGNAMAWRHRRFDGLEHCLKVQWQWRPWGILSGIVSIALLLALLALRLTMPRF